MPCFTISNFLFLTTETAQFIVVTTVADSPWIPFPHGYTRTTARVYPDFNIWP